MSDSDNQSAIDALVENASNGASSNDVDAGSGGADWTDEGGGSTESDIEVLRAERDSYLADSQRLAADFANYRKQSEKRVADSAASQSSALVRDLLPVLDACDSALEQDSDSEVGPIRSALLGELLKNGLELIGPGAGEAFDPEHHDAVQHDPTPAGETAEADDENGAEEDEGSNGIVVAELLRAGYAWKGRVIRPAMVKVVG